MGAIDHLTVALDYLRHGYDFSRVADQARNEEVIVAFPHDDVLHTGLDKRIAIEPGQRAGADEIMQHAIAADAGVEHGKARSGPLGL